VNYSPVLASSREDYYGPDVVDVQYEAGDAWDALDTQDGREGFEDETTDIDETCEPANLVLRPVSLSGLYGSRNCEQVRVSEIRVLLFQGGSLVLDETSPCLADTVVVGPVAPGDYELAAIAVQELLFYATGWERLQALYPDLLLPECLYPDILCDPLSVTLLPCTNSFISLDLWCFPLYCDDCCG
jgi:hypothetical protein